MPHSHFEVTVYQSYYKRTLPLYHALAVRKERRIACRCFSFSIWYKCKYKFNNIYEICMVYTSK